MYYSSVSSHSIMRRNHPTTMKTTTAKTATTTKTTTKYDDNSENDFPFCALEKAE